MKRILVYIGHPAQYHFFRNALSVLKRDGKEIKILIKTKDVLEDLTSSPLYASLALLSDYQHWSTFLFSN